MSYVVMIGGMSMQAVGTYLRELRTAAQLTQDKAAELIGVDKKTIERWEKGEHEPKATTLQEYVQALRGSVQRALNLLLGAPEPEPPQLSERHVRALVDLSEDELNLLIQIAEKIKRR